MGEAEWRLCSLPSTVIFLGRCSWGFLSISWNFHSKHTRLPDRRSSGESCRGGFSPYSLLPCAPSVRETCHPCSWIKEVPEPQLVLLRVWHITLCYQWRWCAGLGERSRVELCHEHTLTLPWHSESKGREGAPPPWGVHINCCLVRTARTLMGLLGCFNYYYF